MISGIIFFGIQAVQLGYLLYHWFYFKKNIKKPSPAVFEQYSVSVVIPARNEEHNIIRCLDSLRRQTYPHFEIIVINDASTDQTQELALQWKKENQEIPFRLLSLTEDQHPSPKKRAITKGIEASESDWIFTLDADCITSSSWLEEMLSFASTTAGARNTVMIAGPLKIDSGNRLVHKLQALEAAGFLALTAGGIKGGAPLLCNGANLGFKRNFFWEAGGYEDNFTKASGDDLFLLAKAARIYPQGIAFAQSPGAVVTTYPQKDWRSFLRQRLRWVSKNAKLGDPLQKFLMLNAWLSAATLLPFWGYQIAFAFDLWSLMGIAFKLGGELLILYSGSVFFSQRRLVLFYPILSPLYAIYITVFGFLSFFSFTYRWKDRTLR